MAVPVDRPYPVTITKTVPVPQPYGVPQPYPVPVSTPLTSVHVGAPSVVSGGIGLSHGISGVSALGGISTLGLGHLGGVSTLGGGYGVGLGLGSYAPAYASLASPVLSSSAIKVISAPSFGSIYPGPIRHGGISLGIIKTVSSPHKFGFSKFHW